MQTTFCLYVLMLCSIGVGVCHGRDELGLQGFNLNLFMHSKPNGNHHNTSPPEQACPVESNVSIKNLSGWGIKHLLPPTSQQNSSRPTNQPETRTTDNNSKPTRWWVDPKLTLMNEQVSKITLDLVEGFAKQTNNTQITSGKLVELEKTVHEGFGNQTSILTLNISGRLTALAETVQEGFAKQTNDTQITSDQLVALVKTVQEGFAKQTNDTQITSDQLAKTHAQVDTGLQNLTFVMSQMTDHLDMHLKNISQLCVSKSTCDPCNCSDNAKNNDQQAHCTTPKSCLKVHFQSSSQSMWLVFGFLAVFTYYTTQSSHTKQTKVDGTKTKLQNIESIVERINGQTNQLTVEVQTYKKKEADLERNAALLQLHMNTKQSGHKLEDFDQVLAIQRLAENRQAMLRDKLLESKLKIWRNFDKFDKQITLRLVFNAWNYTRRLHDNLLICIDKWSSCVERENSNLNVLKRNFGAWRELGEENTITAQINLGMIEKMQEMNVHNFNVLQHINTIIPDVNAIREQYEQELTMLQKAIANTARRRRARSIMYASFFVLFLCVAGYIAAMLNSGTLTWPASIDDAAFLMYNNTVQSMKMQKLSIPQPDWSELYKWFIEKIQLVCEFAIMCLALMFCIWFIGYCNGTFPLPFNDPTKKSSDESVETNKAAATSKQEEIEDADRASSNELKNETKTSEHSGGNVQSLKIVQQVDKQNVAVTSKQSQGESDSKTPVENEAAQKRTQTTPDPQIAKAAVDGEGIKNANPAPSKELKNEFQTIEQPDQKQVMKDDRTVTAEEDEEGSFSTCKATTSKGLPCQNKIPADSEYCWRHNPAKQQKSTRFASSKTVA
jgi:hypothetical protein